VYVHTSDEVNNFYAIYRYLGDMLDADGGYDSAVTIRSAWNNEYLPILTGKGFLLRRCPLGGH